MTYRIRIITFANGRKEYLPQVKHEFKGLFKKKVEWVGLHTDGEEVKIGGVTMHEREKALKAIDLHYSGNYREINVEFEYIEKR